MTIFKLLLKVTKGIKFIYSHNNNNLMPLIKAIT